MPRATRRQLQSFDRDDASSASTSRQGSQSRDNAWEYAPSPSGSTSAYNDSIYDHENNGEGRDEDEYGRMDDEGDGDGGSAWDDGEGEALDEEALEAYANGVDEEEEESVTRSGKRKTAYGRGTEASDSETSASSAAGTPTKGVRGKCGGTATTPTSAAKRRKLASGSPAPYTPSPSKSKGNARSRLNSNKKSTPTSNAASANWWTKLLSDATAGDDLSVQQGQGRTGFTSLNAADRYFLAAARPKTRKDAAAGGPNGFAHLMDGSDRGDGSDSDGRSGASDAEMDDEKGRKGKRGLLPLNGSGQAKRVKREPRKEKSQKAVANLRKDYDYWTTLLTGQSYPSSSTLPNAQPSQSGPTSSPAHSLLFFGYGSKRSLLNDFSTTHLAPLGHVITINGLYPGIGIRDILQEIEGAFDAEAEGGKKGIRNVEVEEGIMGPGRYDAEGSQEVKGLEKVAARLYKYFLPTDAFPSVASNPSPTSSRPLFLVIHNIDSPTLRTPQSLSILSLLALNPRIHLVASFDHANTPILFSSTENTARKHTSAKGEWKGAIDRRRGFGWAWIRADTYADYEMESIWMRQRMGGVVNMDGDKIGAHAGGEVTEEGAQRILHSVPPMARRLFKLLATRQLTAIQPEDDSPHFPTPTTPHAPTHAIDNDILRKLARDRFIAREEERYNAQMGEFRDHGLIVEHVLDAEGRTGKWLWIPVGRVVLERVVGSMTAVDA